MSVTPEMIAELRTQYYARVPNWAEEIHPIDGERIKDDSWLKKFLEHQELSIQDSLQMLTETCAWRKSFGSNEISESNINMEFMAEGLFYPRGKDIDGSTVFIFKSKKHVKGARDSEEVKRCVIYWFERLDKIEKCRRISVFFDMADTGLSNMDMDFTKYLIGLFKFYYPDFLNYILIYEMPWVLSAAFKVIKTLLPAKAVAKMKFITKATVKDFIPQEHIQKAWGGPDEYIYTFVPEPLMGNSSGSSDATAKKVTFADPGSPSEENAPDNFGQGDEENKISRISLSPSDVIMFTRDGADMTGSFALTNTSTGSISFKIKTTSPEKFRVRPSAGMLAAGATQPIGLMLLEGYHYPTVCKDKFLVMCIPTATVDLSPQDVHTLWKDTSNVHVELYKLRCTFPAKQPLKNGNALKAISSTSAERSATGKPERTGDSEEQSNEVNQIISAYKLNRDALDSQLTSLKTIQLANLTLTSMLLCFLIYFFWFSSQKDEGMGEFCGRP